MARSRKVEPQAAVKAAMNAFWKNGYGAMGTRRIEDETGITRFTLQTSYGGKKGLFLQTLDTYLAGFSAESWVDKSEGAIEGIARWFERRVDSDVMPEVAGYGCLMMNSTVEFFGQDADVNGRARDYYATIRGGYALALEAAANAGEVGDDIDIAGSSEILLGLTLGLSSVIRSGGNVTAGQDMATATAGLVRGWAD
jgi:TetR/AcrR family transcriptional repressor of nem operon